jgi:3-oxoacyl-[acyl-carrier-protein] synthase-3
VIRAHIIGTGSCAPETVVTNADLEKSVETSDGWVVGRTGIRERRMAAETEVTPHMAVRAANRPLEMAVCSPRSVGSTQ